MLEVTLAILLLALSIDLVVGELPEPSHPVVWFGRLVAWCDRSPTYPRAYGILLAVSLPLAAGLIAGMTTVLGLALNQWIGVVIGTGWLLSSISLRMLLGVARDVNALVGADLDRARDDIKALVGRETTALDEAGLRSAIIESVAENVSDGYVAPLFGFVIGAQLHPAAGVAVAVWVKAVNTMDSMLGYPDKSIGLGSARLDDIVMYVPARLSAMLLAIAAGRPAAVMRAREWANEPASPNAGWPMATLAAALDTRLEKPTAYVLNPTAPFPTEAMTERGVRVGAFAGALTAGIAVVVVWL